MVKNPVQAFAFVSYREAVKFQRRMAEQGCTSMVAEMQDGMFAVMVKGRPVPIQKAKEEIP